jgi:hypothetical protein
LPRQIIIPQVMKLATLAGVRKLTRHLPEDHRAKATWQLNAAALGDVEPTHARSTPRLPLMPT